MNGSLKALTQTPDALTLKANQHPNHILIMKTYSFKVVVEPDQDGAGNPAWYAYCPALESIGGATSGRTREEALKNINEVVHMIVQEFIEVSRLRV